MTVRSSIPPTPDSSRIQVVESSPDRLVLVLPQGGRNARGLGCFAFFWLLITAAISVPILGAQLGFFGPIKWDGDPPPNWAIGLFFAVFWGVGLGMGYAWLKMSFTRTMLSLEPTRFAVQFELFGKKSLRVLELDANSSAELVEAYRQNESPVYRIAMTGVGGEEKFGTALEVIEKEWLVTAINCFLGHDLTRLSQPETRGDISYHSGTCPQCSSELRAISGGCVCDRCGYLSDLPLASVRKPSPSKSYPTFNGLSVVQTEQTAELSPADLPASSRLSVDDSNPDAAKITYVAIPPGPVKYGITAFLGLFCCGWFGGAATFMSIGLKDVLKDGVAGPQILFVIIPVIFLVSGLLPLFVLCVVAFGRCVILINGDWVRGRLQFGPFFKEKRIATASIADVGLGVSSSESSMVPVRGRPRRSGLRGPVAMIFSQQLSLPLSLSSDVSFNRELAGLVAYQLRQFGHAVPHE